MDGRIHGAEKALECLLVANNGLPGHVDSTSALPPKAEVSAADSEQPTLDVCLAPNSRRKWAWRWRSACDPMRPFQPFKVGPV